MIQIKFLQMNSVATMMTFESADMKRSDRFSLSRHMNVVEHVSLLEVNK